ncbi:hypothetical protein SAMN04489867_2476 [Pedococcus dokdonensis]|uniref:Acyl-CoA dehydrogenase n=1 Tax=Pedococcus dokdonensis TaxID=443156 RepID=A0A1H0SRZ8_9MICO|nr:hypothetical protein [Pedococcus dokdonensis]SDP44339.1 hypothetical protein SAMN04489867_2476 [Pedococcus dokdonensis]
MNTQGTTQLVLVDRALDPKLVKTIAAMGYDSGRAACASDTVGAALQLARTWGRRLERPGQGRTAQLWSALATIGSVDLTVARVVEPHLDALAILAESESEGVAGAGGGDRTTSVPRDATWGVYAAEGPGPRLTATQRGSGWVLDGHKPWCSLADRVSHALVTAWVDDSTRGLFAVALGDRGVTPVTAQGAWVSHGLPEVTSCGMDVSGVLARPVGAPGWYLQRPGFAWGGVGVAAVWFGAAVAVARRVARHVGQRPPDQVAHLHVGQLELAVSTAREALAVAARAADGGSNEDPGLVATRTRSIVADAVETALQVADHAMGPGPLATDAEHVQRVSDLRLYVRQHHAERDLADLGRRALAAAGDGPPW